MLRDADARPDLLASMVELHQLSTMDAATLAREIAAGRVRAETEEQALQWLAEEYGLGYTALENIEPDRELLSRFSARVLLKEELLPLRQVNGAIEIAVSRLFASPGLDSLRAVTDAKLQPVLAPSEALQREIKKHLGVGADTLNLLEPVTVEPMRAFPLIKDLVTDVSWNFRVKPGIKKFKPRKPDAADGTWRMAQRDIDRVQEFRKCIECFLCQDVCHVLRDHKMHDQFIGPRFLTYTAALEMNHLDSGDRLAALKDQHGVGLCNITRCCTKVCPEHITITENAIIPLKERVVDQFYDPVKKLLRVFRT